MSSSHHHLFHRTHLMRCLPVLIYETYLLLSTSLLWVFQPSAHYAQDNTPYHQLSISASCTCLSQTKCTILWDSSYPTLTASPSTKGLWYRYRPNFLLHHIRPFGGWRAASLQLNEDLTSGFSATQGKLSNSHPTFHFWTGGNYVLLDLFFSPPSRYDLTTLVNYFFGCLRDSVPNARRDWHCRNFLPSDPLQLPQNFFLVHVVMSALC